MLTREIVPRVGREDANRAVGERRGNGGCREGAELVVVREQGQRNLVMLDVTGNVVIILHTFILDFRERNVL